MLCVCGDVCCVCVCGCVVVGWVGMLFVGGRGLLMCVGVCVCGVCLSMYVLCVCRCVVLVVALWCSVSC